MSGNDPFFDAWVRDKLLYTEARTPEHLWDKIRKRSRTYVIMERNKYLLILLLLLGTTAGTGYWVFHPGPEKEPSPQAGVSQPPVSAVPTPMSASRAANASQARVADQSGRTNAGRIGSVIGSFIGSVAGSGIPNAGLSDPVIPNAAPPASTRQLPVSGITGSDITVSGTTLPEAAGTDIAASGMTAGTELQFTALNSDVNGLDDIQDQPAFVMNRLSPAPRAASADETVGPIRPRNARHTYLEFYAGPDHIKHYITAGEKAFDGYVTQKRNMENSYPSFSVGARLDMPLAGNDWRLQLGIHYSQINEKMNYSNFNAYKTITEVSVRTIVQPTGNAVLVSDTSTVSVKGQLVKQSLNAYRRIDIPVIVSRTLFKTGQVQVNGSAGAMFNVTSWYNGDILDTNNLPVVIQTKTAQDASAWKKHIGTSLYGSLSLYDQLFKHVQVTFEPYLRYDLTTVNKDVSIYRERFVTTGLMVGIRYQLGK